MSSIGGKPVEVAGQGLGSRVGHAHDWSWVENGRLMGHRASMDEPALSDVTVKAEVRLLSASESGRIGPIRGSYRPNHNFFGPDDRNMTVGFIDLPDGSELHPGQSMEATITFLGWPGLADQVYEGREWRIQEGVRLVGFGRVIEVLPS